MHGHAGRLYIYIYIYMYMIYMMIICQTIYKPERPLQVGCILPCSAAPHHDVMKIMPCWPWGAAALMCNDGLAGTVLQGCHVFLPV